MINKASRPEQGKLQKTRHMNRNNNLKSFIPETRVFNRHNLEAMLHKYMLVYVKPDKGNHGIGVYKVQRIKNGQYRYQVGIEKRSFTTFNSLFKSINRKAKTRRYLVQKGITTLVHKGRPFDIRIMVQRNMDTRRWHVNGMAGRIAGPGRVVSNYYRGKTGGTVKSVDALLIPYMPHHVIKTKKRLLKKSAYSVAMHMQSKYPRLNEIGVDVVFDKRHKPWFLEVNTRYPSKRLFRLLNNKTMYRRIVQFSEQIKRFELWKSGR